MSKNDAIISLLATLDIDDSVTQLNNDIDKVSKKLKKLIVNAKFDKKVEKDIRSLIQSLSLLQKATAAVENKQINLTSKSDDINKIIDRLDKLDAKIDNIKSVDVAAKGSGLDKVNEELTDVKASADSAGNSIRQMLSNIGINLSTYQAFRLLKQAIQEVSDAVDDYNKYHTNLRIITGGTDQSVDDMLAGYTEESIKLGIDIEEYENAAEAILRTGKNAAETNMILKDSAVLSKTGFIDSEKAANNLITIANAYDLEAEAIQNVVDKILSLDVASQTEGGALSTAVARTAKNAQLAGVTIDSLAAQIANLRDVTGKEEEQIATSLNSIYSRMYNVKLGKFIIEDESGVDDITEDISDMEKILKRVDIQLRDSKGTFRDFDDIIKDLHDNWNNFNEVEKSAIGKTIGGTYHRNVALAMIQDYEDFQHLQDISLQSAGTAAERYEAYTDSIAAKSAQLNTALKQMWANTISSDLVVGVKSATTEIVQFIDKYEVLQNLMKTAVIYGAAKGFIYLGGTIKDVYSNFKALSQAFNTITTLSQTATGTKAYQTALSQLTTYTQGLSEAQIKLLFSTGQLTQAEMMQVLQTRGLTAEQASAALATMGLAAAEGTATTATFTLSGAFKALTAAMLSNPIGLIATGLMGIFTLITALKNKAEEAEQAAQQLREQAEQNISAYKTETKSLDSLIDKYVELSNSTTDTEKVRSELADIQSQLIDNYGTEAEKIDLVNGKYSEQIDKLSEVQRMRAEAFVNAQENIDAYNEALNNLHNAGNVNGSIDVEVGFRGGISQDIIDYWQQEKMIIDSLQYSVGDNDYGFVLNNNGDLETLYQTIDRMAESYKELSTEAGNFNREQYTAIKQQAIAARDTYNQSKDLVELFERNRAIAEFKLGDDVQKQFDELLDRAGELNKVLGSDATAGVKYNAVKELDDIHKQLNEIAADNPGLINIIEQTFSAIDEGSEDTLTSIGDIRTAWFESLAEMDKGVLKNVDTLTKAIQSIAEGSGISHDDFWAITKLDTDKILGVAKIENGEFIVDQERLIELKDHYIQQQIESLKIQQSANKTALKGLEDEKSALIEELELQKKILESGSDTTPERLSAARDRIKQINELISQNETNQAKYNEQINNTNLLIAEWNSKLGDTVDKTELLKRLQEQLTAAQKKADEAEKVITGAIDNNIKKLNNEKSVLNDQKDALNDQLKILEEQKEEIESIITDYNNVAKVVKNVTEEAIEDLEELQQAQEDAIQSKIDALKESHDQQEKENKLAEKELALKEKLANLEKAKNTKVRTYSAERGFHFDVDKEAVMNAESEVAKAQADYDKALADDVYDKQLKALEKEKDLVKSNFKEQIEAIEEYQNLWTESLEEQTNADNERLAEQILGSDWREKINNKDIALLNKYKTSYNQYNNQLNSLVKNEIKTLNDSIKAKEAEVKAVEQQIKKQQEFKSQVEDTITSVKNQYDGYMNELDRLSLKENASYEERQNALANFRNAYQGYVAEIASIQSQIQSVNAGIYIQTNIPQVRDEMAVFIDSYRSAIEAMQKSLEESLTGYGVVNSEWDARLAAAANALRRGYASGGVIDYTGVASVHGSKSSAETVFNAAQSKELYNMVKTGEFSTQVANKAYEGIASALKGMTPNSTNNSSTIINVNQEINNPVNGAQFANEFNKNMEQYWKIKLTESYVK